MSMFLENILNIIRFKKKKLKSVPQFETRPEVNLTVQLKHFGFKPFALFWLYRKLLPKLIATKPLYHFLILN